jgi:hypothetical protein
MVAALQGALVSGALANNYEAQQAAREALTLALG